MENPLEHFSNRLLKSTRISISNSLKGQLPNTSNFLSRFSLYRLNISNFERIYTLYKKKAECIYKSNFEEADKIDNLITKECDIELLKAFIKSNKFHGFFDNNVNESKLNELESIVGNVNITKKSTPGENSSVDGTTSGDESKNGVSEAVDKIKTDLMSQVFSIGISKNIRELLDKAKKINSIEILKEVYELTMLIRLSHPQLRKALDTDIKHFISRNFNKDPFYFHKNEELVFIKTQDEDSCYFSEVHIDYFFLDNLGNINESKLESDSIEFNINDQFGNVSSIKSRRLITEFKQDKSFKLPSVLKKIITDKNTSLQSLLEKAILQSIDNDGTDLGSFYRYVLGNTKVIEKLSPEQIKDITLKAIDKGTDLFGFYRDVLPNIIDRLSPEQIKDIIDSAIKNGGWLYAFYQFVLGNTKVIEKLSPEQIKDIIDSAIKNGTGLNTFYRSFLGNTKAIEKLLEEENEQNLEYIKEIIKSAIQSGTGLGSFYQHILPSFIEKFSEIFDVEYIKKIIDTALTKDTGLDNFYQHVLPILINKLLEEENEQNIEYIKEIIDKALTNNTGLDNFYQHVLPKVIEKLPPDQIKEIIDKALTNNTGLGDFYIYVLPKVFEIILIGIYLIGKLSQKQIKEIIDKALTNNTGLGDFYIYVLPRFIDKFPEIFDVEYIKEIILEAIKKCTETDLDDFSIYVLPLLKNRLTPEEIKVITLEAIDNGTELNVFYRYVLPSFIDKLFEEENEQNLEYIKEIIKSVIKSGKELDAFYSAQPLISLFLTGDTLEDDYFKYLTLRNNTKKEYKTKVDYIGLIIKILEFNYPTILEFNYPNRFIRLEDTPKSGSKMLRRYVKKVIKNLLTNNQKSTLFNIAEGLHAIMLDRLKRWEENQSLLGQTQGIEVEVLRGINTTGLGQQDWLDRYPRDTVFGEVRRGVYVNELPRTDWGVVLPALGIPQDEGELNHQTYEVAPSPSPSGLEQNILLSMLIHSGFIDFNLIRSNPEHELYSLHISTVFPPEVIEKGNFIAKYKKIAIILGCQYSSIQRLGYKGFNSGGSEIAIKTPSQSTAIVPINPKQEEWAKTGQLSIVEMRLFDVNERTRNLIFNKQYIDFLVREAFSGNEGACEVLDTFIHESEKIIKNYLNLTNVQNTSEVAEALHNLTPDDLKLFRRKMNEKLSTAVTHVMVMLEKNKKEKG